MQCQSSYPRARLRAGTDAAAAVPQPVQSGAAALVDELADGNVCEAATGTMALIGGEPVRYPCIVSRPEESQKRRVDCGLLGTLHPGTVWRADKVCFTIAPSDRGPPFKLLNRGTVLIRRLWE